MRSKSRDISALVVITLLMSVVVICTLALYGNSSQVFTDVVIEYTAEHQSNKSLEMNLLYGINFGGMLLYAGYYYLQSKKGRTCCTGYKNMSPVDEGTVIGMICACALVCIALTRFLVYESIFTLAIGAVLYIVLCFLIDKTLVGTGFVTYFMTTYAVCALHRVFVHFGSESSRTTSFVAVVALLIAALPLVFSKKEKQMLRLCLAEGLLVPFTLLLLLMDTYVLADGSIVEIKPARAVDLTIWLFIVVFFAEALWRCVKFWNKSKVSVGDIINIGACIAIIEFNRFSGMGAVLPTDVHHPYEDIIAFTQMFELGQTPFENFIPISGMYSVVHGAVLHFFGNEQFANYFACTELLTLLVAAIIVLLLRKNVKKEILFLISVTLFFDTYNRVFFLLPIMLLLSSPNLIKDKNRWLNVWFLSSMFHGLYYPLYGAATCIGFMPFGIYQFVSYIKSGLYKEEMKTIKFWLRWGISIILLVAASGYLLGTLQHTLVMSGQTILADGISRFGQILPASLFPYLADYKGIQYVIYYLFTWITPTMPVWIAFICMLRSGEVSVLGKKISIKNIEPFCMFSSIIIILLISYSYTFVRLDIASLCARAGRPLVAACIMLLVYGLRYLKNNRNLLYIVAVFAAIPIIVGYSGISGLDNKLVANYTVPEGYIYVEDDSIEKLGTCLIDEPMYNTLKTYETNYAQFDRSQLHLGTFAWFGYYYYTDIKGAASIEIAPTVKGLQVAEEAIDYIKNNNAIVGITSDPVRNYYFYHWLLTSGEYYWKEGTEVFYPNNGTYTKEEVWAINKGLQVSHDNLDLGREASSFGESMETLSTLFEKPAVSCDIVKGETSAEIIFSEEIEGDQADWLYIEFEDMEEYFDYVCFDGSQQYVQDRKDLSWLEKLLLKKDYNTGMVVEIRWEDDEMKTHTMHCNMSRGKLLIPLGSGLKWLLHSHRAIDILVYQDDEIIEMPDIGAVELLKLREAK